MTNEDRERLVEAHDPSVRSHRGVLRVDNLRRAARSLPVWWWIVVGGVAPLLAGIAVLATERPQEYRPGSAFIAIIVVLAALGGLPAAASATVTSSILFTTAIHDRLPDEGGQAPARWREVLFIGSALLVLWIVHRLETRSRVEEQRRLVAEAVWQNAPVGVAVFDRELRYVWVNDAMARIDRAHVEEMIGAHPAQLWPDVVWDDIVREVFERGLPKTDVPIAGRDRFGDGRWHEYRCSYYPVGADDNGPLLVAALVEDVTADAVLQRNAGRLLRWTTALAEVGERAELARRLPAVLDESLDARSTLAFLAPQSLPLDVLRAAKGATRAGVVLCSTAAEARSVAAALGDAGAVCSGALVCVPVPSREDPAYAEVLLQITWDGERRFDQSDADLYDTLVVAVGLALDRIDAVESAAADQFRLALNSMLDAVAIGRAVRDEDGGIVDFELVYANERSLDGAGREANDMVGRRVLDLYPGFVESGLFERFKTVVETGRAHVSDRVHYVDQTPDGPIDGYWSLQVVRMSVDRYLAVSRDVTQTVRDEEELAQARLAEASERVAVGLLQQVALPESLPELPGVRLGAVYLAADSASPVGGDWYDAFELPGDRLALVIGDITGHGRESAVEMVRLRHLIALQAADGAPPDVVLNRTNDALIRLGRPGGYATCLYLVVDVPGRLITLARAGHPPPLHVTSCGARPIESPGGPPLGVLPGHRYPRSTLSCRHGDAVVIYTDGLIERRGIPIDQGIQRLARTATRLHSADPQTFTELVASAMFDVGERRQDDLCLLTCYLE